jgi:hypothetical protein
MCWACEQEQMLAAYRDYVARRKAAQDATPEAGAETIAADDDAWAAGTWFEVKIPRKE